MSKLFQKEKKKEALSLSDVSSVVKLGNAFSHACGILSLIDPEIHCWSLKTMRSLTSLLED